MARKKSGKPSRTPRLFHVGHVPQSRSREGLPAPPTIPCLNPQSLRQPTVVKLKPTIVGGNQSLKESMDLGPFQADGSSDRLAIEFSRNAFLGMIQIEENLRHASR
jgi:hypothetical protein